MLYRIVKRTLDIVGSLIGLAVLAPFYPLIALAIKLETKGPVFAKIDRVSAGKKFQVYKFRSMIDGAHALRPTLKEFNERKDGPFFKMARDPRVTMVGRLLRKFRIDEFPQLINVLKGEMSLVGPRPHEPGEVIYYPPEYRHLMLAKAGVTGLSQVNGASGLPFIKELELDSQYVNHPSLLTDARIVAKTAAIIFFDPTAV